MPLDLPFLDLIIENILYIDLVITIAVFIFVPYARSKEITYAKDNKDPKAIRWHWRMVRTVIFWSIFVVSTLLYHFTP